MWLWSCFDGLRVIIPFFFPSLFLALFAFIYKCFSRLDIGISGFILLHIYILDTLSKSVELNYSRASGFHGPELPMTSPSESFISRDNVAVGFIHILSQTPCLTLSTYGFRVASHECSVLNTGAGLEHCHHDDEEVA
jgi:hypothetical protein